MIILFFRKWFEAQRLSAGWSLGKSYYFGITNGSRKGYDFESTFIHVLYSSAKCSVK